jgi:hypothetical protein
MTWGAPARQPRTDWFPWAAGVVLLLCLWSGWETYQTEPSHPSHTEAQP